MAKYGSGLSSQDVCKLELEEMEGILKKYNVSEEDAETLKDMLKEAYFQLNKAYACGRVLEKHLKEDFKFQDFIREFTGEELKYVE